MLQSTGTSEQLKNNNNPLFSLLSQFDLKIKHFCYLYVENYLWKYGQEGSFFASLMWNPNIKTIHITKLVFNSRFGYFEYVGHVLHGLTLEGIVLS